MAGGDRKESRGRRLSSQICENSTDWRRWFPRNKQQIAVRQSNGTRLVLIINFARRLRIFFRCGLGVRRSLRVLCLSDRRQ